jgi:hypothetical protein
MKELRDAYVRALTPTQAQGVQELTDARTVASACELCGAYFDIATTGVRTRMA